MKKSVVIIIFAVLLLVPLASAGFFDWFTGKVTQETDLAITVGNTPPTVDFISVTGSTIAPLENSAKLITFSVLASDHDGVNDLDDISLFVNFSSSGEATRSSIGGNCALVGDINSTTANYTC